MNSEPNPKATSPDVLIVHADEGRPPAYRQVARADYRQLARADDQTAGVTKYKPDQEATQPGDVLIARADEGLGQTYEQIAPTGELLARATEQPSTPEHDVAHRHTVVPEAGPSRDRPALRGLVGLLLAACIFAAAFASYSPYGYAARHLIARWMPWLVVTSSAPLKNAGFAMQPGASVDQAAGASRAPAAAEPDGGVDGSRAKGKERAGDRRQQGHWACDRRAVRR